MVRNVDEKSKNRISINKKKVPHLVLLSEMPNILTFTLLIKYDILPFPIKTYSRKQQILENCPVKNLICKR
jgi:hypothetical protein